jgi:eukaryotic-like serine/threonine-protein kinase
MHPGFETGQDILQRYHLTSVLGEGGFGAVLRAEQRSTRQQVAVKVLVTGSYGPEHHRTEQQRRFWREVALVGKLSSPHIVRLIDSGFVEGTLWKQLLADTQDAGLRRVLERLVGEDAPVMVMELVQGRSLRDHLDHGSLPPSTVKRVIGQCLEALSEAHRLGVVHRDLKPENIMVSGAGKFLSAKVLDFGIAGIVSEQGGEDLNGPDFEAITRRGQVHGTLAYMAPEQLVLFSEPRIETDIYAMGLILIECLTGCQAFTGESTMDLCNKQMQAPVEVPPEVDALGFGDIVRRACEKEYQQRYRSAEEMFAALEKLNLAPEVADRALFSFADDPTGDMSVISATISRPTVSPIPPSHRKTTPETAPATAKAPPPAPLSDKKPATARRGNPVLIAIAVAALAALGTTLALLVARQPASDAAQTPSLTATQPPAAPAPDAADPAPDAADPAPDAADPAPDAADPAPEDTASAPQLTAEDAINRAQSAFVAGLYDAALADFTLAISLDPNHPDALAGLGRLLASQGQHSAAIPHLRRALLASGDNPAVILDLAASLAASQQRDEARSTIERFLKTFPDHPRAADLLAYLDTLTSPTAPPSVDPPIQPDGKPTKPDGKPTKPDGKPTKPDGKPTKPDGKPTKPDGKPTKPDGTTPSTSGTGIDDID